MFLSSGDLIKRFPCGTIQQPYMDEILRLLQQNDIKAANIEKIDVGGNQSNFNTLFQHHPTTGLEAKFSMEFCIAILLLEHKAGLSQFTDAVVQRPDVQEMIRRVNFYVDPEYNKSQGEVLLSVLSEAGIIKIHMKDGKVLTGRTQASKGSPKNPMTYEEVADKFRGNAEFAKWPATKAASVIELVKSLERQPDMSALTAALTA